jgi:phytoene dehydrogenase-like protein
MGSETESVVVKTYVPPYQKDRWREHADQLGMSQSEFVRTMVQAGRRDFEIPADDEEPPGEGTSGLEPQVKAALDPDDHRSWDELLERVTDDVEDRLEEALSSLQAANVVQYSGRHGGYTLVSEP